MSKVKVINNTTKNQTFDLPNGNKQTLNKDDFIIIGDSKNIKDDYIIKLLLKGLKIATIKDDSESSNDVSNTNNIELNNQPKRKRGRPRKIKND